ncbi:MAG: hypothetical protein AAFY60_18180, partial [Myxococcota bacterium]
SIVAETSTIRPSRTFSEQARELATADIPVSEPERVELPQLDLPARLAPRPLRQATDAQALEVPAESTENRGALGRVYDAAHARLREAAHDVALDDFAVSIGVGEIEFEILEGRQLTGTQREVLRAHPHQAIARTRVEIDIDLIPQLELDGLRWNANTPLTVVVETPIDILELGADGRPRAVQWDDVLQVLKNRTVATIRDGVPTLDGSSLGGEPWPIGGRVELRGAFRQRVDGRIEQLTGNAERIDEIFVTAQRLREDRVDVQVGRLDDTRLRPRLNLEEIRLHGNAHFRELAQSVYPLNPQTPSHREAFRDLFDLREVLGVNALPTLSTDSLDALGIGHARYDFSRSLDPSPHVRVPLGYLTAGAGIRRYDQVGGWVQHPRRADEGPLSADEMERRLESLLNGDPAAL